MTENAHRFLIERGYPVELIAVPPELNYKTGSDVCLYIDAPNQGEIAPLLTRERYIVMRVFKDYKKQ